MSLSQIRNNCGGFIKHIRRRFVTSVNELEYSETPEYPKIFDTSKAACKKRTIESWHEKIKSLKTVEEKLIEINMPKYYGYRCVLLNEGEMPYNSLAFTQYVTRTHLIEIKDFPSFYSTSGIIEQATNVVERMKSKIEDALVFEYKFRRRKHEFHEGEDNYLSPGQIDDIIGKSVLQQINHIIFTNLSMDFPHLHQSQVDLDPRVESFWFVGGIDPTNRIIKARKNNKFLKDSIKYPINWPVQYFGSPLMHLRHELPLPPIVDLEESYNSDFSVPVFQYDPRVLGFHVKRRHGTNIPGFWPGDPCEFGSLTFHSRGHLLDSPDTHGDIDHGEALHAQAILASYGWLMPLATYQGFSTFNDVTYPLVTQTVLSNGQYWSFYMYQLNTTLLHSQYATENPRCNICWGTDTMKLFEAIEDDKVIGFNEDVLKKLLMFYLNTPNLREGIEMKPYLGEEVKRIADIPDEEHRAWLEKCFKHMYSNRPRHRLLPEVYHWEKIYKIDHKTRPMDARRRPFELGINPYRRRYDEHQPEYIPKILRSEKKRKIKWAKTYYP